MTNDRELGLLVLRLGDLGRVPWLGGPPFPTTAKSGRNRVHIIASQVNLEVVKWQPHRRDGDH